MPDEKRRRAFATLAACLTGLQTGIPRSASAAARLQPAVRVATGDTAPAVHAPASPFPASGRQSLRVYYGDHTRRLQVAVCSVDWNCTADRYSAAATAHAVGVAAMVYTGHVTQSSQGRVAGNVLLPERYTEKRGERPARVVEFDRAAQVMRGSGTPPEVALRNGVQDRLSVHFQIAAMLARDPARFAPGERFDIELATTSSIETAVLRVVSDTPIRIDREDYPARHLNVRVKEPRDDAQIDVWLSPRLGWRPARLRVRDDKGQIIDQVHQSLEALPTPSSGAAPATAAAR